MGLLSNQMIAGAAGAAAGGGSTIYDYQIAKSFRWDSGYLKWTPGSAGNRQTWTFSCWVKKTKNIYMNILDAGSGGDQDTRIRMYWYDNKLSASSANANFNASAAVYRDPSAWQHIVWKLTGGTSYQYVNGTLASSYSVSGDTAMSNTVEHTIGIEVSKDASSKFFGYIAEVVFIDGTALDPTSFASEKNGVWIPKEIDLTFGSQGYHLDFADASAPGNDVSGNNNDWTNVSLATHDQMTDTPTFNSSSNGGNFMTYNGAMVGSNNALAEGNLKSTGSSAGNTSGTFGMLTGKWYWECRAETVNSYGPTFGIGQFGAAGSDGQYYIITWQTSAGQMYGGGGYPAGMGTITVTSTGVSSLSSGDILSFWLDCDNGKLWIGKNGTIPNSGDPANGTNPQASWSTIPTNRYFNATCQNVGSGVGVLNAGQNPSFNGAITAGTNTDKNGYGLFNYDPSGTDFIACCAANIPTADAIDPAQTSDNYPQKLHNPIIWTGNGGTLNVTGLGYQPDLVWYKRRDSASGHILMDSTRGTSKALESNNNGSQDTSFTSGITAFGTDGFTLGNQSQGNASGGTYVGWSWRANGGSTSSGSGDLTSTHQVDPSGGFSIVTAVGDGGSGDKTVSHGLSAAPTVILAKNLDVSYNWDTYFANGVTAGSGIRLNTTEAPFTGRWGTVNSSIFTCKDNYTWAGTNNYIYYCFTNIDGYIKSGSYRGNGQSGSNGIYVYTGFKPAFVLVRKTSVNNWRIEDNARDTYNPAYHMLVPNSSAAEDAYTDGTDYNDFLSNGFKLATGGDAANWNANGETYIYLAFAKNPFKYATAR